MRNDGLSREGDIDWSLDNRWHWENGVKQFGSSIESYLYSHLEALREIAEQLKRIADNNEPKSEKSLDEQAAEFVPEVTIVCDTVFDADAKVGDIITDGRELNRITSIGFGIERGNYVRIKPLNWFEVIIYRFKKWRGGE